jgi:hypothetical protein
VGATPKNCSTASASSTVNNTTRACSMFSPPRWRTRKELPPGPGGSSQGNEKPPRDREERQKRRTDPDWGGEWGRSVLIGTCVHLRVQGADRVPPADPSCARPRLGVGALRWVGPGHLTVIVEHGFRAANHQRRDQYRVPAAPKRAADLSKWMLVRSNRLLEIPVSAEFATEMVRATGGAATLVGRRTSRVIGPGRGCHCGGSAGDGEDSCEHCRGYKLLHFRSCLSLLYWIDILDLTVIRQPTPRWIHAL